MLAPPAEPELPAALARGRAGRSWRTSLQPEKRHGNPKGTLNPKNPPEPMKATLLASVWKTVRDEAPSAGSCPLARPYVQGETSTKRSYLEEP